MEVGPRPEWSLEDRLKRLARYASIAMGALEWNATEEDGRRRDASCRPRLACNMPTPLRPTFIAYVKLTYHLQAQVIETPETIGLT